MPDDVTRLLEAWREGQPGAADRVFSLMYDDLRAVARRQLARLQPGQTLAPTAVVHEAYMKFAQRSGPEAGNREHFLGIAARAMRNIVVDYIRRQRARKRDAPHVAPDAAATRSVDDSPIDILAMDEALKQLARLDARQAAVVELRFFGGLELKEIAAVLDTRSGPSSATGRRRARFFRWHLASHDGPSAPDSADHPAAIMPNSSGQLDAEMWRRIGAVIDRISSADVDPRPDAVAAACQAEGIPLALVTPFLSAAAGGSALPEQIDAAIVSAALDDLSDRVAQIPPLAAGDRLGPYQIVVRLGAGGMGEVYTARDTRLGRTVALKRLHPDLATSAAARVRFEREARLISAPPRRHIRAGS